MASAPHGAVLTCASSHTLCCLRPANGTAPGALKKAAQGLGTRRALQGGNCNADEGNYAYVNVSGQYIPAAPAAYLACIDLATDTVGRSGAVSA